MDNGFAVRGRRHQCVEVGKFLAPDTVKADDLVTGTLQVPCHVPARVTRIAGDKNSHRVGEARGLRSRDPGT